MATIYPHLDWQHVSSNSSSSAPGIRTNPQRPVGADTRPHHSSNRYVTLAIRCVAFALSFLAFRTVADVQTNSFTLKSARILLVLLVLSFMLMGSSAILDMLFSSIGFVSEGGKSSISAAAVHVCSQLVPFLFPGLLCTIFTVVSFALLLKSNALVVLVWVVVVGFLQQCSQLSYSLIASYGRLTAEGDDYCQDLVLFISDHVNLRIDVCRRVAVANTFCSVSQLCLLMFLCLNAATTDNESQAAMVRQLPAYFTSVAGMFASALLLGFSLPRSFVGWMLAGQCCGANVVNGLLYVFSAVLAGDVGLLIAFGPTALIENIELYLICKVVLWAAAGVCATVLATYEIYSFIKEQKEELFAKRAFIGYVSHEIRNPVSTTVLGIDMLLDSMHGSTPEMSKPQVVDILKDLKASCDVATNTLNDVLLFDKIRSNLFTLELGPVKALKFIRKAVKPFRLQAAAASIRLTCVTRGFNIEHLRMELDNHKMVQVMRNLLSNAFKFTPPGGEITVQISLEDTFSDLSGGVVKPLWKPRKASNSEASPVGVFRVAVVDSGVGISKANISKLFGRYVQFHANEHQDGKGSGLGLWISKMIVEMHCGMVGAISDGEGKGTTIFFELPYFERPRTPEVVQRAPPPQIQARPADSNAIEVVSLDNDDAVPVMVPSVVVPDVESGPVSGSLVVAEDALGSLARNVSSSLVGSPTRGHSDMSLQRNDGAPTALFSPISPTIGKPATSIRDMAPRVPSFATMPSIDSRKDLFRSGASSSFSGWRLGDEDGEVSTQRCPNPNLTDDKLRYLIVDDSALTRKLVTMLVRPMSLSADDAENGVVAVAKVREAMAAATPFDIVLIDFNMPQKNGPAAIREMRAMQFAGIIVGLSAAVEDELARFYDAGADVVLTKPLKLDELKAALATRNRGSHHGIAP